MKAGPQILVDSVQQSPVVALCVWVQAGSCDEEDDQRGAAHFVEHMLFKGTERRAVGDVALEIEGLGGDVNAFTTYDHTAYFATVPAEGWRQALDVLADMTQHSLFDADEVELEREVILEEIRGGGDDPLRMLGEAVAAQAFEPHPYSRPVIGTRRSVRRMSREALLRYWKRWYSPANLIVSISGPVDAEEVQAAVDELFGRGLAPPRKVRPEVAVRSRRRSAIVADLFDEPAVELAFPGVPFSHLDAAALDVLAGMLGGSPASVLGANLQHGRQLAVDTWAVCECERDAGLLVLGLSPLRGRLADVAEAASTLVAEVRAGHHLDRAGMERAKAQIIAARLFGEESVESRAMDRAWYAAFTGDAGGGDRYAARVDAVSLQDVRRVAATVLQPGPLVLGALLPRGEVSAKDLRKRVRSPVVRAPKPPVAIRREVLPDGMTLVVEPVEHSKVVAMRLVGLGGGLTEGPASAGRGEMWSQVVGMPGMSPTDLADFLDRRGGSLNGVAGDNSIGLRCEFPARNVDDGLDLMESLVHQPHFDLDELERVRATMLENEALTADDPSLLAWRLAARRLFGDHPYGLPTTGTRRSLKALNAGSLMAMHRRDLRPSNLVLAVAGGVDPDRTLRSLKRRFGRGDSRAWRMGPRARPPFPRGLAPHVLKHDREQAQVLLAFPGARFSSSEADALTLAASILGGQAGRLFIELRDKRGLAYQVGAESLDGWDAGRLVLAMGTEVSRAREALDGLWSVIRQLAEEGPSLEELERARNTARGSLAMARQRSSARATELAFYERYGMPAHRARQMAARALDSVTPGDVGRALGSRMDQGVPVLAVSE